MTAKCYDILDFRKKETFFFNNYLHKIEEMSLWHFLWIGIIIAEFFTFIMNYILSLFWRESISTELLFVGAVDAFIVAVLVSSALIYFVNNIREANIANRQSSQEIKTFGELLPICSSCQDIRDEEGAWNKVEQFIRQNYRAEFTHSICPDCVRELYPDLADKILAKQDHNI